MESVYNSIHIHLLFDWDLFNGPHSGRLCSKGRQCLYERLARAGEHDALVRELRAEERSARHHHVLPFCITSKYELLPLHACLICDRGIVRPSPNEYGLCLSLWITVVSYVIVLISDVVAGKCVMTGLVLSLN